MKTAMAITKISRGSHPVTELDPAVDQRISGAPDATRLPDVHSGQVVQPRPDSLSRTAPPVQMIKAEAITPASAILRIASCSDEQDVGHGPDRASRPDGVRGWAGY